MRSETRLLSGTLSRSGVNGKVSFDLADRANNVLICLLPLRHCWPYSMIICFQSYAQADPELFLQQSEDDCASPKLWCEVICCGESMYVWFTAHGNRGVSASQIFKRCVVLPWEVEKEKKNLTLRQQNRRAYPLESLRSADLLFPENGST